MSSIQPGRRKLKLQRVGPDEHSQEADYRLLLEMASSGGDAERADAGGRRTTSKSSAREPRRNDGRGLGPQGGGGRGSGGRLVAPESRVESGLYE
jgi:hypothetical protein